MLLVSFFPLLLSSNKATVSASGVLAAARNLQGSIDVEVIDPRSLHPLDVDTITRSVRKTGRLVVVHESPTRAGVGAEIVRVVVDRAFDWLDAPPQVLGGSDIPLPFSPGLERACLPQQEDIERVVTDVVNGKT